MSCPKWRTDIALYAGGDLAGSRAAQVESHLDGCTECRALLEELQASRALLREWDEPLEDVMMAQVRRRVMARVGEARRPRLALWKLALAAALVLAAILAFPWLARKPQQAARVEPARKVEHAPTPVAPAAIVPVRHHLVRRRRAPVQHARAQRPSAPLLVQFVTDDPNIVIYWLVDQKPEGD